MIEYIDRKNGTKKQEDTCETLLLKLLEGFTLLTNMYLTCELFF